MAEVRAGGARVVVVDAVPRSRAELVRALEADGDVAVVGQCDGDDAALDTVLALRPDVVVLTGTAGHPATPTVETIMAFVPTPILVLHPPAEDGADAGRENLGAGAVGVLPWSPEGGPGTDERLRRKIRVLRGVTVVRHPRARLRPQGRHPGPGHGPSGDVRPVIGMAASTGGPHTLARVIGGLTAIEVPVLIVQHIHPDFVDGFVEWVARTTGAAVTIATAGAVPEPGVFHIAPAGVHLKLTPSGRLALDTAPLTGGTTTAETGAGAGGSGSNKRRDKRTNGGTKRTGARTGAVQTNGGMRERGPVHERAAQTNGGTTRAGTGAGAGSGWQREQGEWQ